MNKLLVLLTLFQLAGCGILNKDSHSPSTTAPRPPLSPKEDTRGLSATLIEGAAPQAFQVHLKWPELPESAEAWTLLRESKTRNRTALGILEKGTREFIDNDVQPGEFCRYLLIEGTTVESARAFRAEIAIPRDLEIQGSKTFRTISGIHRLFLRAGSTLIAEEGALEINVDEIVSEGATITSFLQDAVPPQGQAGRSGGYLVIKAAKGNGILFVNGRGERGGAGQPGVPGVAGTVGAQGTPFKMQLSAELRKSRWSEFIDAAVLLHDLRNKPLNDPHWQNLECLTPPGNGQPGTSGGKGGQGFTGNRGGDGAKIFAHIQNPSGIEIRPTSLPGLGGKGGAGGPGGIGGPGGGPGVRDPAHFCPAAQSGLQGPMGPLGDEGPEGPSGVTNPVCLKMGSAVYGECQAFPSVPPFTD